MFYDNTLQMALFDDENEGVKSPKLTPKPADINSAAANSASPLAATTSFTHDKFSVSQLMNFVHAGLH